MKLSEVHHSKQVGATVVAPDGKEALVWCFAPRPKDAWGHYARPEKVWLWRDGNIVMLHNWDVFRSAAECRELEVVGLHPAYTTPRKGRRFAETQVELPLAA